LVSLNEHGTDAKVQQELFRHADVEWIVVKQQLGQKRLL
jgi:hypothetical protein